MVVNDRADGIDGIRGGVGDPDGIFVEQRWLIRLPNTLNLAGAGFDAKYSITGRSINGASGTDAQREVAVPGHGAEVLGQP